MLKITLFGVGSLKHRQLASNLHAAVESYSNGITTEEINDVDSFVTYGVGAIPALAINDTVLTKGVVPSIDEIKFFIQQFLNNNDSIAAH